MSTLLFKKNEVVGKTKDEIVANAAPEMNLMVDATQAFNKWKENNPTNEDNVRDWMKEYLRKKKYDKAGLGAYIVTQSGVKDTRERPYKIEKPKYEKRTHSPEKFYVLRAEDGTEVGREKTSKAAEQAAKDWIIANQKGLEINIEWRAKEKNTLYAKALYTPSKGAKPYKALVFGYVAAD